MQLPDQCMQWTVICLCLVCAWYSFWFLLFWAFAVRVSWQIKCVCAPFRSLESMYLQVASCKLWPMKTCTQILARPEYLQLHSVQNVAIEYMQSYIVQDRGHELVPTAIHCPSTCNHRKHNTITKMTTFVTPQASRLRRKLMFYEFDTRNQ